jgi:phospholipid/cholesterol/gamma-HCH transport system substrate-binding protein
MKQTPVNNLKLGIFVSVSILLFVAGIYLVGQRQQLFSSTFNISGIFRDINGLQIGNNVRFSGINVGVVNDIQQITDSSVRVELQINEQTRKFIKKNAKAVIGSDGLMGNKILLIIPGAYGKKALNDGDYIETTQPTSIDDIMIKIKETADNASMITADLSLVMRNIREGKGTIGKIMMDSSFARNIDKSMINIKNGTGGFKDNMEAASHNILLRGFLKKKKKNANKEVTDSKSNK